MLARFIEILTGKDDLERVASKNDLRLLNAYLKNRTLLIPKKPKRYLRADTFSQAELQKRIEAEAEELGGDRFEPWILEVDGKRRLPAFSSQKKMLVFSSKISQQLNKVFSLGCAEVLLDDVTRNVDLDYVDLNSFSEISWEIGVKQHSG